MRRTIDASTAWVHPAVLMTAALAGALAGYLHDGGLGAVVSGLACVGGLALIGALRAGAGTGAPGTRADAELRGIVHDLRSSVAATAAAFAVLDEHLGEQLGDRLHGGDAGFFRDAVRRNLEEAQRRLAALEHRIGRHVPARGGSPPRPPA